MPNTPPEARDSGATGGRVGRLSFPRLMGGMLGRGCWRLLPVFLSGMLASCLPLPDIRLGPQTPPPSYRAPVEAVRTSFEPIDGAAAPGTPVELNRTFVLRYHLSEPAHTVVVLMPGIFGGATSFDPLARQLVAALPGTEVWAIDRRANALEDREGFRDAIRQRDPQIALDYYGPDRGDHGFQPVEPDAVRFMAEWGLDVHLEDLDAVVAEARMRFDRVVLGGHSLGASLVSLYAAYTPQMASDPRGDRLAGLLLLDGTLGRTGAFATGAPMPGVWGADLLPTAADLEAGRFPPFLNLFLTPEYYATRAVIAQLGYYRPDDDAPKALTRFPMSNRALAGVSVDDDYHSVPYFGASVGKAANAAFDGNLAAFILTGHHGAGSSSVAGPAPGADRVEWTAGPPGDEHTDLGSHLRSWTHPAADYNEWYFPLRLAIDMGDLDPRLENDPRFVPTSAVTVPTIAFGAGRGLVSDLDGFSTYLNLRYGSPIAAYVLPDFTHLDIVSAAENPVVPILAKWLEQLDRSP